MQLINQQKKVSKSSAGFTLVELMVSVSIFVIIVTMSTSAILSALDANRNVQRTASAMDNLSFTLDSISRTLRYANNYTVSTDGKKIDFKYFDKPMTFEWNGMGEPVIKKTYHSSFSTADIESTQSMTSGAVALSKVYFQKFIGEKGLSRIAVTIEGTTTAIKSKENFFHLETLVSQRNAD